MKILNRLKCELTRSLKRRSTLYFKLIFTCDVGRRGDGTEKGNHPQNVIFTCNTGGGKRKRKSSSKCEKGNERSILFDYDCIRQNMLKLPTYSNSDFLRGFGGNLKRNNLWRGSRVMRYYEMSIFLY